MKKNGFTLAELLGVIVLLSLISLITVPTISGTIKKYKVRVCNTQLEQIVAAAKNWGQDNLQALPSESCNESNYSKCTKFVTLRTLVKMNYLDKDVKNAVTGDKYDLDNTKIYVSKKGKKFYYELDTDTMNSCVEKRDSDKK